MVDRLKEFLDFNPSSEIKIIDKYLMVINPWNDDSLFFHFNLDAIDKVVSILNNLILSPRFTAIYHKDLKEMEFIYTLLEKKDERLNRNFDFNYCGKTYNCSFRHSSDRLLFLAENYKPSGKPSVYDYRNLSLFKNYIKLKNKKEIEDFIPEVIANMVPVSFFINNLEEWDEESFIDIFKHVNFFMKYYDRRTPTILIHQDIDENSEPIKQLQFLDPKFPTSITCSKKNIFLLDLISAADNVATRLQFIYYYQVLEYAAFYYIDNEIKKRINFLLHNPGLLSKIDESVSNIIDIFTSIRQSDEAKINKVVEVYCDPIILWQEIKENLPYFSKEQVFEGGFKLKEFIPSDIDSESFSKIWLPKTPDFFRKIRNALVHGRERRQEFLISPSKSNDLKLKPWNNVIRRAAEQIAIYSDF